MLIFTSSWLNGRNIHSVQISMTNETSMAVEKCVHDIYIQSYFPLSVDYN